MSDQEKFHYPLPEDDGSSRWDGLSKPAREAVTAKAASAGSASELLKGEKSTILSPEAISWAEGELVWALESWRSCSKDLLFVPESVDKLSETHANYNATIARLFEAKQRLQESDELTPNNQNIGESMELILVPWQDFRQALPRLEVYLNRWRRSHSLDRDYSDSIDEDLLQFIKNDCALYRNPDLALPRLSPSEYLESKVAQDGLWGIMLAQLGEPGVESTKDKSPDGLTGNGHDHLTVAGQVVDSMGVFEWLSLALQKYPSVLGGDGRASWLLANRVPPKEDHEDTSIGYGRWDASNMSVFTSLTQTASATSADIIQPRLAVL